MRGVTTEDSVAINDLLARYCWAVDDGESDEWVKLWTEDGVFTGIAPEPIVGTEALKGVPTDCFKNFQGGVRHFIGNIVADYGDTRDIAIVRVYNYVSLWGAGDQSRNMMMALAKYTLVRRDGDWLIQRNDANVLMP